MARIIPSAYELASRRIISSKYAEQIELQEQRDKIAHEDEDALPDFVDSWERPDKGEGVSPLIEDNETPTYTKKDIIAAQSVVKEKEYMPVEEKQTIHYDTPSLEVHWYGHFTSYSGFSRLNRAMAFGLSNRNVKVKVDMQKSPIEINAATNKEFQFLSKLEIPPDAPKVYGATVPLKLAHAGKKILYTMMETSQTLHPDYVGKINLYEEIWVPTTEGKNLFKANNVHPPIYVMPLGVDIYRYHPNTKPMNFNFGLKKFVFLSVFKWGYRKGYDILLKAFMEGFSSDDDVSLLIVSRTDVQHQANVIAQDFQRIRNGVLKSNEDLPHIALYDKMIREKDMPKIYAASNAFVLISRGEGFGLTYYEAAASGLPVIGSNCSGQKDLLCEEGAYLVEPDNYVKARINGPLPSLAKHCGFYEDQIFPDFGRPAIEATKEHMRNVYEDQEGSEIKAAILAKKVRENYTWDMAVDKVYKRLREIN